MGSAVEDRGNWFCSKIDDTWAMALFRHGGPSHFAPEDAEKVRDNPTQIAECLVDGRRVLLIFAEYPKLDFAGWRPLADAARKRLGDAAVLVITAMSEGYIRADASLCDSADGLTTAIMAAAVIKARWAWDESKRIRIETIERTVDVEPLSDGTVWTATIVNDVAK